MDQVVFAGVDTAYPRSWKFGAIVKVAAQRYEERVQVYQRKLDDILKAFDR